MNKRTLTAVVTVTLLTALSGAARAQSTFPDVPDNHWAAAAVKTLAEVGIVEGYPAAPRSATAPKDEAAATATRVKRALIGEKRLDNRYINVSLGSEDKTLLLSGTVFSIFERDLAGQIAARNGDGLKLLNRLTIGGKPFSR